jgi:hypothetical protein
MRHAFGRLGLAFSDQEMSAICPLTCKFDESNKWHVIKTVLSCETAIRCTNDKMQIYDQESLDSALKTRFGWARHTIRHRIVTIIKKSTCKLETWLPGNTGKHAIYMINRVANHLEVHGPISILKRLFNLIATLFRTC